MRWQFLVSWYNTNVKCLSAWHFSVGDSRLRLKFVWDWWIPTQTTTRKVRCGHCYIITVSKSHYARRYLSDFIFCLLKYREFNHKILFTYARTIDNKTFKCKTKVYLRFGDSYTLLKS